MDTKHKEQLQRALVFTGLGLLFTLSIWFIFRPSANEQSAAVQGLNKDVPQASPDELPTSKLKAYELGRDEEAEGRKNQLLGTLADYFNREGEAKAEPEPSEEVPAAIGRSIDKYEETARELESFYDLPAVEDDDIKRELNALRAELGALKEEKAQANGEVDQLELLEKSYQMAAKYLPSGNATPNPSANSSDKSVKPPASELPAAELSPERETVVSSLDQPISDSAFIAEYGYKERNMGFCSVGKKASFIARNTLSVVVDRTTTIRQGDFLRLRLAESARIEGMTLPPNTVLIAQSTIDGNRMKLHVTSVEHAGRILAVKLSAFDLDGQEGLSIPGSEEVSALKEVGAGVGGTIGTSFASSAKDQLIAEAARGVMQGASQLLQKKLRTIKVTVKSGHRLFLVQAK